MTFATLTVTLDGKPVIARARAAIVDGRSLLPVRSVGTALGAAVRYDAATGAVIVRKTAVPARIINGRAYAPLRPLAGALALGVHYDGPTRTVALRTQTRVSTIPAPFSTRTPPQPRPRFAEPDSPLTPAPTAPPSVYAPYPVATAQIASPEQMRGAPSTPYPIAWVGLDRIVTPGMRTFDVLVHGAPGMFGVVAVDGVNERFPLQVLGANDYVAHVVLPEGIYVPFAHVGARIQLPDGTSRTIVLPQTVLLMTRTPAPVASPTPAPTPTATPHPKRTSQPRRPLARTRPTPEP